MAVIWFLGMVKTFSRTFGDRRKTGTDLHRMSHQFDESYKENLTDSQNQLVTNWYKPWQQSLGHHVSAHNSPQYGNSGRREQFPHVWVSSRQKERRSGRVLFVVSPIWAQFIRRTPANIQKSAIARRKGFGKVSMFADFKDVDSLFSHFSPPLRWGV